MTALTQPVETSSRCVMISILIGCATMFVILELGVTFLAALIVISIVVLVAILFEGQVFKHDVAQGLRTIGYGEPKPHVATPTIRLVDILELPYRTLLAFGCFCKLAWFPGLSLSKPFTQTIRG